MGDAQRRPSCSAGAASCPRPSRLRGRCGRAGRAPPASEGLALQLNLLGVVQQPVEDRVSIGGVVDHPMPCVHGELAGDDGGLPAISFLENLEQVMAGFGRERLEAPVIESRSSQRDSIYVQRTVMWSDLNIPAINSRFNCSHST